MLSSRKKKQKRKRVFLSTGNNKNENNIIPKERTILSSGNYTNIKLDLNGTDYKKLDMTMFVLMEFFFKKLTGLIVSGRGHDCSDCLLRYMEQQ